MTRFRYDSAVRAASGFLGTATRRKPRAAVCRCVICYESYLFICDLLLNHWLRVSESAGEFSKERKSENLRSAKDEQARSDLRGDPDPEIADVLCRQSDRLSDWPRSAGRARGAGGPRVFRARPNTYITGCVDENRDKPRRALHAPHTRRRRGRDRWISTRHGHTSRVPLYPLW